MARKLRILAFHSFRTSANIFQQQMSRVGLDKDLEDLLDITFIDAPNPASGPIPDDVTPFFEGPYYEWWNVKQMPNGQWEMLNWEAAMQLAEDIMHQQGPFDGVLGFSQGGAMASLVMALQWSGRRFQNLPKLRFMVGFAGIKLRIKQLNPLYAALANVPACHIIGDRDPIKELTNHLIECFDEPVVINHTKGHVIPALPPSDLETLRDFLVSQRPTESKL